MLKAISLLITLTAIPAYAVTIFERIDFDKIIAFNELKTKVKTHARSSNTNYLALGETHSQANTTHLIAMELIKTYQENVNKNDVTKLCLEELPAFYQREDYQAQKELFNFEEIYQNNSPYRTDFKKCADPKVNKYITYSGMFHMFDYTTTFPGELDTSILARRENNFINLQMPYKNSMFIAQINLYINEILANGKLFKDKITDPTLFETKVDQLIKARKDLISHFEYLYTGTDIYNSKLGAVIPADAIKDQRLPKNTFLVLTDLEYRVKDDMSFLLLKQLRQRPSNEIALMLKTINNYPIFLPASAAGFEKQNDETDPRICYGVQAGFCFPFFAQFMEIKLNNRYDLYVALKDELKCYTRKPTVTLSDKKGKQTKKSYPFIQQNCTEQILLYGK